MPHRVRKLIRIGLRRVRALREVRNMKKKNLKLIFNNPRSSILSGSAPDLIIYKYYPFVMHVWHGNSIRKISLFSVAIKDRYL